MAGDSTCQTMPSFALRSKLLCSQISITPATTYLAYVSSSMAHPTTLLKRRGMMPRCEDNWKTWVFGLSSLGMTRKYGLR